MKERSLRTLKPEITKELLPLAERLTGKKPVVRWVDSLPHDTGAMLVGPETSSKPYEIRLARGSARFVDHHIAHEVGHLVRLYSVAPEERLMPVVTSAAAERAIEQALPELGPILEAWPDPKSLGDLCFEWVTGVVSQLASFPADLRIEAWLRQRFPGLRAIQQRALLEEVGRNGPLFHPVVVESTPRTFYYPTMAMNAAQAWQVAMFYNRPDVLQQFQRYSLAIPGRNLARMVLDASDEGHRSDMAAVDQWAEELGLQGWFEWQGYQESR